MRTATEIYRRPTRDSVYWYGTSVIFLMRRTVGERPCKHPDRLNS